jgi:hypothetical protein
VATSSYDNLEASVTELLEIFRLETDDVAVHLEGLAATFDGKIRVLSTLPQIGLAFNNVPNLRNDARRGHLAPARTVLIA